MEIIPINVYVERRSYQPILTITCVAKQVPMIERFLFQKAFFIIEQGTKLDAKVIAPNENDRKVNVIEGQIALRFCFIFRNEEELKKGIEGLRRGLK